MSYDFGGVRLDAQSRRVYIDGKEVTVGGVGLRLLHELIRAGGNPVDNPTLILAVWGKAGNKQNLRQGIYDLRKAIKPALIRNDRESAYALVGTEASAGPREAEAAQPALDLTPAAVETSDGVAGEAVHETLEEMVEAPALAAAPVVETDPVRVTATRAKPIWRRIAVAGLGLPTLAACCFWGLHVWTMPSPMPSPTILEGRFLARFTSESGEQPIFIPLPFKPYHIVADPRLPKAYLSNANERLLITIDAQSYDVKETLLRKDGGPLVATPDSRLFVASRNNALLVMDASGSRPIPKSEVATDGPAVSMSITPNGQVLYLALGKKGVQRIGLPTLERSILSPLACPESLAVDPGGRRLYVAYQCGGPGGRPGHDTVEVFDTATGAAIDRLSGPPLVGSLPVISPDGRRVVVASEDACRSPRYDHQGCPAVPSTLFHIWEPQSKTLAAAIAKTLGEFPTRFLDKSRLLVSGDAFSVYDTDANLTLERFAMPNRSTGHVVLTPDGALAIVAGVEPSGVYIVKLEPSGCSLSDDALIMAYAFDGVFTDAAAMETLSLHGNPVFVPGRVGQAIQFKDGAWLSRFWGGRAALPGAHDVTLSLYVKPEAIGKPQVLIDIAGGGKIRGGAQLRLAADGRFEFAAAGAGRIGSRTIARAGTWHLLTVRANSAGTQLFIDGMPEGEGPPVAAIDPVGPALALGATERGDRGFSGKLDEFFYWNRSLAAEEIRHAFQLREAGPCKL